jgi:hypothetical protein
MSHDLVAPKINTNPKQVKDSSEIMTGKKQFRNWEGLSHIHAYLSGRSVHSALSAMDWTG